MDKDLIGIGAIGLGLAFGNLGLALIGGAVLLDPPRVKIPVRHEGSMKGYKVHENEEARHKALDRAVKEFGYKKAMDKLNALYVFNKNKHKDIASIVEKDKQYIQNKYKGE